MEELKKIAANFGFEYVEKKELFEKKPLLGLLVASVCAQGFEFGFNYEGTMDDFQEEIAELSIEHIKTNYEAIFEKDPIFAIAVTVAFMDGAEGGIGKREKFKLERDAKGDIIGISTNKTEQQ